MKFKKTLAALMASALVLSSAGCTINGDQTWSAKAGDTTLPTGVYIYQLYNAYSQAQAKLNYDNSLDMKKEKIEDQEAYSWIVDNAKKLVNQQFVVNDMMKELGLSLTEEDNSTIKTATDSTWNGSSSTAGVGSTLEKYNVAKSSFQIAYAEYTIKFQKVFEAIYGEGGSKAVSAEDQKAYFEENFASWEMVPVSLYSIDYTTGAYSVLDDEQKATLKTELEGYVNDVKEGKKTMSEVGDAYKNAHTDTETASLYQDRTEDLAESTLPTDFIDGVKSLSGGEVKFLDIGSYYVVAKKRDISERTEEALKDVNTRLSVLSALKGQEFADEVGEKAKNYEGSTFNDAVLKAYTPDLFYTAPVSSAPSSSAASSEAASGASSEAASSEAVSSAAESASSAA